MRKNIINGNKTFAQALHEFNDSASTPKILEAYRVQSLLSAIVFAYHKEIDPKIGLSLLINLRKTGFSDPAIYMPVLTYYKTQNILPLSECKSFEEYPVVPILLITLVFSPVFSINPDIADKNPIVHPVITSC